jgi:hypothetical protein
LIKKDFKFALWGGEIMKFLSFLVLILLPTFSFAKSARLFSIYRTNYYTDRTLAYDLDYDDKNCRITDTQPIRTYFVSSSSGAKLNGSLSAQNKNYFNARSINSPNAQTLNFKFKAINELEALLGRNLSIQVELMNTSKGCSPKINFLSSGSVFLNDLRTIDVEFILKNIAGLGEHPQGISWVKLKGKAQQKCLYGKCK